MPVLDLVNKAAHPRRDLCSFSCVDPVKVQLNSQDAGTKVLRLATAAYPSAAWVNADRDASSEEWATRQGLSSWVWRLISELKEVDEDGEHYP